MEAIGILPADTTQKQKFKHIAKKEIIAPPVKIQSCTPKSVPVVPKLSIAAPSSANFEIIA